VTSTEGYRFRPAARDDLPMLRRWLETPEVRRWWGDPDEQEALLRDDLDDSRMTMLIVSLDGRPFAYVQHCRVHGWPQPHLAHLPAEARAIDPLIGEPDMLGGGHGPKFLRLLAEQLKRDGAPMVVIDPDVDNHRARRAYAKAGFVGDDVVETDEGPAILMVHGA